MDDQNTLSQEFEKQKNRKPRQSGKVVLFFLYLTFCVSLLVVSVPVSRASVFALMINICILAAVYTFRVRAQKARNKFVIMHTTYMIRSFWRACLVFIIFGFAGVLYMLVAVEYDPLEKCTSAMSDAICKGHFRVLLKIFDICGNLIVEKNKAHLHVAGFIVFSPLFLYVLWRGVKGGMLLDFAKRQKIGK